MTDELCPKCQKNRASTRKSRLCAACWKLEPKPKPVVNVVPAELLAKAANAKTTEDWQKLAAELAPTLAAILNGDAKATAAQASLLKDIMNRAFGKPVAVQQEKRVAAGIIVLPKLDDGDKTMICPRCGFDATKDMEWKVPNKFSGDQTTDHKQPS